jgi:hypothetical protein
MRTIETTVYKYDELSDSAKESARNLYLRDGLQYDWWNSVYDDFNSICKIIGIVDVKPQFSGFSSQGDGASFAGYYSYGKGSLAKLREYAPQDTELHEVAESIAAIQRKAFYGLSERIETRGRYCHEYSMACDNAELLEQFRRLARWLYKSLESEYDYLTSAECVAETIRANDYEFTESGKIC